MNISFALLLSVVVILTGIICLLDIIYFKKKRAKKNNNKMPKIIEYSRSFFPVLFIVLVIRSFVAQPYYVPSGSLEPTLMPGELLLVTQYSYGLRLPVLNKKIVNINEPQRGDIAVFRWPEDPSKNFVKRVIGLPGDHIQYQDKILYINGKQISQKDIGLALDEEPAADIPVQKKEENLLGTVHDVFINPQANTSLAGDFDITVPQGEYFMMGDNRDNSDDSRYWGPVDEKYLIGKAQLVWMSWDKEQHNVRWQRLGTLL